MRVLRIDLDEAELPERVTVEMTRDEAVLIADQIGNVTPTTAAAHEVWSALNGGVFNRFWEDGIDGARSEART